MKKLVDLGLIYGAYCTISKKWYIGQTIRTFKERKKEHKDSSFNPNQEDYNTIFHRAIRKYGIENFIWFIIEDNISVPYYYKNDKKISDYNYIDKREKYWITNKNSYKYGYNMTEGGHDSSWKSALVTPVCQYTKAGIKINEYESIIDASCKTNIQYSNIIACLKGRKKSAGGFIWIYTSDNNSEQIEPYKKIQRFKRICQYSMDGVKIKEYESIIDAEYKTNIYRTSISACARGRYKSAGGYIWKFLTDDNSEKIEPYKKYKQPTKYVCQYSMDGVKINEYESAYIASQETGISHGNISGCLTGKVRSAGGYIWKFLTDDNSEKIEPYKKYKPLCKRICQYSMDGVKIKEYESIHIASQETGISHGNISGCLTGRKYYHSAGGFIWRYAEIG